MNSSELTTALLCWLRFGRQMPYSATEVEIAHYRADVLGATEKEIIEIEVKVSINDFRGDFKNKAGKHQNYKDRMFGTVPNRIYFAVPEILKDSALEILIDKAPDYGLISMRQNSGSYDDSIPWKRLSIVKRAKHLHRDCPSDTFLKSIVNRMSSEIAHFHLGHIMSADMISRFKEVSHAMSEGK